MPSSLAASGPSRWADFSGPNLAPTVKPGERAWMLLPVSTGWETLKLSIENVERVTELEVVVKTSGNREVFVPSALTSPLPRVEAFVNGDTVVVPTTGSRAIARVVSVASPNATVRYRYAGELKEVAVPFTDLIKLDGTLKFGAVVVARDASRNANGQEKVAWRTGQFVSSTEGKTWIVTWAGRPFRFEASSVKPVMCHVPYKAGDKVTVLAEDNLSKGTVLSSEDDGLRYVVKLEQGTETTVPFDSVSGPLP
jgi:hypothetical protein